MVVLDLLSHNQEAFTKGRHIADQIKLAKEMLNGFGRRTTASRFCMSMDLRKFFDSISWSAINATLEGFGFSIEMHFILKECYSTPSFFILNDGEPIELLKSQRGLRQDFPPTRQPNNGIMSQILNAKER